MEPVVQPSGEKRRVSPATIYRWLRAFLKSGLSGLEPRRRSDRGKKRSRLPALVVKKALALLSKDDELSLPFVIGILSMDPQIVRLLEAAGVDKISRSTLQRRLAGTELYPRLRRAAKKNASRSSRSSSRGAHVAAAEAPPSGPIEAPPRGA